MAALGKWWAPRFSDLEVLATAINFIVSFALLSAVFAMLYKLMPRVEIGWGDVWAGAIVTALLFSVGKLLIGLYIGKSAIGSGFGAAGSLVVFCWYGFTILHKLCFWEPSSHGCILKPVVRAKVCSPLKKEPKHYQRKAI
jgi:uncharacterized BrkB/YihY/UPF0761 family membrane protein